MGSSPHTSLTNGPEGRSWVASYVLRFETIGLASGSFDVITKPLTGQLFHRHRAAVLSLPIADS